MRTAGLAASFIALGAAEPAEARDVDASVNLGATFALNDNQRVVGQASGSTITFGYKIDAQATVEHKRHEWRNTLYFAQGLTRTPLLPVVVKSQDLLRFESVHLYRFLPWAGSYARFAGDGPLLASYDERATATTYAVRRLDGTTERISTRHLPLTGMARPFTLKEGIGIFARLLERAEANAELRLGVGARHTFANGQRALQDDAATPEVDVRELATFHQAGAETSGAVWGALEGGRLLYKAGYDVMAPLYRSDEPMLSERTTLALTNLEAYATVSVKIADWASLDYNLRALRQPQLVDATQVQNNLLLTFGLARATGRPGRR